MEEQDKVNIEQSTETKEQFPATDEQSEQHEEQHKLKETTEKIWGSTRHAFNAATFKANQYKKLVQKRIDQSAIHKKVNVAHGDLGKTIDDLREAGQKNLMNHASVKEILDRIDELKAEAATLEAEVEQIRAEEMPQEELKTEEKKDQTH